MQKMSKDNESVNVKRQVSEAPAKPKGKYAGADTKGDVKGVQGGGSRAEGSKGPGNTSLKHATAHVREMHKHGDWKMER